MKEVPLTESRVGVLVKGATIVVALCAQFFAVKAQTDRLRDDLSEIKTELHEHRGELARHNVEIAVMKEQRR